MKKLKNFLVELKNSFGNEKNYFRETIKAIRSSHRGDKLGEYSKNYVKEFFNEKGKYREENLLHNSDDMKIPIIIDQNFSRYLQKFMHSYRNKEHPTININNLLFLSGPEKNGKSWFLRDNLKKFSEAVSEKKTMAIHYDIRSIPNQNFNSFLYNLEKEIINSIVERNKYERESHGKDLITIEDLKILLFFRWEKGWLEINISKSLYRSLNENGSPYTFFIDNSKFREEVLYLLENFERKAYNEYVLLHSINRILEIISQSMEIDKLHAGLLLIHDCLIQREDYKKNLQIFKGELYRDGLDVMEFLFDVMNYIAGYHEIQLEQEALENVDNVFIYPHIVLAIESVQELFEMKDSENRPLDYLHRIMLRLYNNSGYRNHFPIILETNKNYYFDKTIYEEMWEMKYAFPSLVYLPTQFWNNMDNILDPIFNNYQKSVAVCNLGDSSIYYYELFVEAIKSNDQRKKFPNTGNVLKREYLKYLYKINKLYVNPKLALSLDKGTIDYEVIDALEQWHKVYIKHEQPYIGIRRLDYDIEYLTQPITLALFEENITFFNKYFKRVHFEQFIYNTFNIFALDLLRKNKMNHIAKRIYYRLYFKYFIAFIFHIDYYTIGQKKYKFTQFREGWEYSSKDWIYGSNLKWDVPDELYKGNTFRDYILPNGQIIPNIH